ncbi:MAG: endonuclease/exonuclease/phosphatase family protein [Polyangiaceae bacterium]
MRHVAFWGLSLVALVAGCPGTNSDFSQPKVDAGSPIPDSAVETGTGTPQPLTLVNWNVKNLYNDVRDSPEVAQADEIILSASQYQAKLTGIAKVLNDLDADVVVLQEVENENVVADLAKAAGRFPHTHITKGNDPRGIDIALLSDVPLGPVLSHKDEFFQSSTDPSRNFKFARDVLEAHLIFNTRHVVLLGVHWKSGTDADSMLKRLAEAEQTRRVATEVKFNDPSAMVVTLGDFNDVPGSPPLVALAGAAPMPLESATANVPTGDRWSVTFGNNPMLFDDQILDPVALTLTDRVFNSSVVILHSGEVDAVADHDPVKVVYQVN